jgi:predicted RNA methylase
MRMLIRLTGQLSKAVQGMLFGAQNPNLHAEQRVDKRGRKQTHWIANTPTLSAPPRKPRGVTESQGLLYDMPHPAAPKQAALLNLAQTARPTEAPVSKVKLPPVPKPTHDARQTLMESAATTPEKTPEVAPIPPMAPAAFTPPENSPRLDAMIKRADREKRLLGATPGEVAGEQILHNGESRTAQLLHDLGIAKQAFEDPEFHATIKSQGFMDLHIERVGGSRLALTHFAEQNGDHYIETEAVYTIHPNGQLKLAEVATNAGHGEHRSLDKSFAKMFARNLIEQGFGKGDLQVDAPEKEEEAPVAEATPAPEPAQEAAPQKPSVTYSMTKKEYQAVHKDFKGTFPDGTRTKLVNENGATVLTPVKIIPEDGSKPLGRFDNDDILNGKLSEGDTKTEDGATYRLNKNHRWERVEEPQAAEVSPSPSDPASGATSTATPTEATSAAPAQPEALTEYVNRLSSPAKKTYALQVAMEANGGPTADPGTLDPDTAKKVRAKVEKYAVATPTTSTDLPPSATPTGKNLSVAPQQKPAPVEKVALSKPNGLDYQQPFPELLRTVPKYAFDLLTRSTRVTRKKANDAALSLARKLHKTSSTPSAEERGVLAKWSGQGGVEADLNAYYTPTKLAASMWALMHQHGFSGGRVLEPSIGGGVFSEVAPNTVQMTGVEYNPDTASVVSLLQPDTKIHNAPFEEYTTSSDDELYDAVIGNPPYGTRGQTRDLHKPEFGEAEQYFIDTCLDRVKDGGLVTVLVNAGVMQNSTSRAFRARLLARAELVTAIRAPVSTFEDAGALVTPDVLVLRKRPTEIGSAMAHLVGKRGEQALKDAGLHREDVMSGQYFSKAVMDGEGNVLDYEDGYHPEQALGQSVRSGRWGQVSVDGELDDRSLEKLATMPADQAPAAPATWNEVQANLQAAGYSDTDLAGANLQSQVSAYPIREGTISADGEYVMRGSRWHRIDDESGGPLMAAKGLARELERYRSDLNGGRTEAAEAARQMLAANVQAFVDEYGDPNTLTPLKDAADARFPYLNHLLASVGEGGLSADLKERQHQLVSTEDVDTSDPTSVSRFLAGRGALTPETLSGMSGMGYDSARDFLTQSEDFAWDGNSWRSARNYFQGDVYDAQDALSRLIEVTPEGALRTKLEKQKERFASLLPYKNIDEMTFSPRDKFIPLNVLEDYLNEKFGMQFTGRYAGETSGNLLRLSYRDGVYEAGTDDEVSSGYMAGKKLNGLKAPEVQEFLNYLNNKTRVASIQGADDMSRDEYEAARKAAIDGAKAYENFEAGQFRTWLLGSDHQDTVEVSYNRQMNSFVTPSDNYDPLRIPGWAGHDLHPYQNNAVRRMTETGTGVIALDVGLGKTLTGLALAANLKAQGKARKPVVVPPKSLLGNWVKNARESLPDRRLLIIGMTETNGKWTEDSAEEKRRKLALMAAEDWDLVIMSRDTFEDIPMRRERRLDLIASDFQAQRQMGMRGRQKFDKKKGKKGDDNATEKEKQEFFEKQLKKVASSGPTDISFEDLGIDCVISDEGHAYKNLYAAPSVFGQDPKFMGAGAESNRAMDFHHKMRHIRSVGNGNGTYILTATPTKNSPLEIYNMLALVSDSLASHGLPGVDDFVDRYCDIEGAIVPTKDGSVKSLPAVVGFKNLSELRGVMNRYLIREDAKTALTKEGIGLKMPTRVDIEQTFDMHPDVAPLYHMLRARAAAVKQGDTGEDHLFSIMSDMRKLTMDPGLYNPSLADLPNPRFERAAELTKKGLDEGGKVVCFMDLGQSSGDDDSGLDGDAYDRLVDHYVRAGVPREQIAVVTAQRVKKASDRSKVEEAFDRGDIRVVIGNTPTIGEGFNLQNGTTDMIHLDTPWDPGTYWQRLGRGERQGNPVENIRNHVLLAKGSFDTMTYGTMLGKKGWQQQVWDTSTDAARNNTGMNLEEIALALSDDPEATRKQIQEARGKLEEGAKAASGKNAMREYGSYLQTRDAWLKRKREANGRKEGPTENDDRVIEKLERTLKAARASLKANEAFAPHAQMLDYPGRIKMLPSGIPLHEGMRFKTMLKGPDGLPLETEMEVGDVYEHTDSVRIQRPGGNGWTVKLSDLPAITSWTPNPDPRHYYDGYHERPGFAKAAQATSPRMKAMLLFKRDDVPQILRT